MKTIKKAFGGIDLSWKRLILFAIVAGVYTGFMALLPFAENTSFADISISFEWWILFGILILLNSKSSLDAGLKCFVFFLISQPLVYLVQVPFFERGWEIFGYYRNWILWTLLTFPMGFIGHYLKKGKWWGLFILAPMMAFLGLHYENFLVETITWFPHHLLSAVFCAATVLLYPLVIFDDRRVRLAGAVIAGVILVAGTVAGVTGNHDFYNTTLLASQESGEGYFDDSYAVSLEDEAYGRVYIDYEDTLECYMVRAEFKKPGTTALILTAPDGRETVYELTVEKDTYQLVKREPGA